MADYVSQIKEVVRDRTGITSILVVPRDDQFTLAFGAGVDGMDTRFIFDVKEAASEVTLYSQPQWNMPKEHFPTTIHFITHLNFMLKNGHVDMDVADGEVRYKTVAVFGSAKDIKPVMSHLFELQIRSGNNILKALEAINNVGADVKTAMQIATNDPMARESPVPEHYFSAVTSMV